MTQEELRAAYDALHADYLVDDPTNEGLYKADSWAFMLAMAEHEEIMSRALRLCMKMMGPTDEMLEEGVAVLLEPDFEDAKRCHKAMTDQALKEIEDVL